jgi:hypothetical protein
MSRDDTLQECQRIVFEVWVRVGRPDRQKQGLEGLALLDAGQDAPAVWREQTPAKDNPKPKWIEAVVKHELAEAIGVVRSAEDSDGGMGDRE